MKLMLQGALGFALISIYLWPSKVGAASVNATIDDQFGDSVTHRLVRYYPSQNFWYNESYYSRYYPFDTSLAFDNTFTYAFNGNGSPAGTLSMQFAGTAIYVFFILTAYPTSITGNGAIFTIDSNDPVLLRGPVSKNQYNVPVFSQTNLSNTLHTLNISTAGGFFLGFDYAIYTYDNGVPTTTSLLSVVTTSSPVPSTSVTGAPARRTPIGAIVGGIVGGITLFVVGVSLLLCWHRRGGRHGGLQSIRGNGGPEPLITQLNDGADSLAVSASGMPYTQPLAVRSESPMATVTVPGESSTTNHQANILNNYQTLHSGGVVLSLRGSQQPSSEKALSSSSVLSTGSSNRIASPLLPSPLNVSGTWEEVRRARQEDLDNRLRVVQHNIVQLEESSAGPGRSVSLRRQISLGEAEIIEEEMQMSMPDMQEAIRSLKEQMRVLREQQQSTWAEGFSDDRPPGYTPTEVGMQIWREASS